MRVVVVGAGLGGLSVACHLVGRGHQVTVLERAAEAGGRAGVLRRAGYSFDTGPTVLTMPHLVDQTFAAAGADAADHVTLRPVDPMYRACFADGSVIHVRHGREAMAAEVAATCGPGEAAAFHRFCDWLTELYRLEMPAFIDRNFDSPLDLVRPLGPALRLVRMGAFRRLGAVVASYFADERLRRLFSFQSLYAGLAPDQALALYAVITYMDTVGGVFAAEGGVHALPSGLAAAATKAGAAFRFGTEVERILLTHGTTGPVQGVRLADGEVVEADVVVCNADLAVAYRTLLGGLPAPRPARSGRWSPSCVLWHAGVQGGLPAGAAHHNIHFGHEWGEAFRALVADGRRMPDPSILVSVPTVDDASLAPPRGHVLYVLEPVPNLDGRVDWRAERPRLRDSLAARVAALGYPTDVAVESLVDPLDWEREGLARGTPFSLAHTLWQTGPFRPGNVDRRAPGLVFVGASTVPGVGVPMVLISGRLAAERVEQFGARR